MRYLIMLLAVGVVACHSADKGKDKGDSAMVNKDSINAVKQDSINRIKDNISLKELYKAFERMSNYDTTKDPMAVKTIHRKFHACNSLKDVELIFRCSINQFDKAKMPIMLCPYYSKWSNEIKDSFFITKLTNIPYDGVPQGTVGYESGIIIDGNINYTCIVYVTYVPDVIEYTIATYTPLAQLINSKSFYWGTGGGYGDDWQICTIQDRKHFQINQLLLESYDLKKAKDIQDQYVINALGKFILMKTDTANMKIPTN